MRSSAGTAANALTLALPVPTSTVDSCTGTLSPASISATRLAAASSNGSSAAHSCSTSGAAPAAVSGAHSRSSTGSNDSHSTSSTSSSRPSSRPSTTSVRTLSTPLRSSRASGSHSPFAAAAASARESGTPSRIWEKMKEMDAEKRPETDSTTSPDCVMSLRVASSGSPEPGAVVSYSHCAELSREACFARLYSAAGPEPAFLLVAMTCTPRLSQHG
mmetsp:Transcript_25736/g.60075  ORF Transcript_25736/g.60075 Transcript_25736/m.60075 type:complete len:217 (+) Transcript_25736:255-905(+)